MRAMKGLSGLLLGRMGKVAFVFVFCYLCTVALLPISNQAFGQTQTVVSGFVTDSSGNPLSGVKVDFRNPSGATVINATTDYYGKFIVAPVAPGSYSLRLTKIGYTPITQSILVTNSEEQQVETMSMSLALSLSSSTLGYVVNAGDRIQIPAALLFTGEGRETITFTVSAPNGWSTRILQGNYEVTKIALTAGQSVTLQLEVNVPTTAAGGATYGVALSAIGTTQANLNFSVSLGTPIFGTVSGQVVDETGKALEKVDIKVSTVSGTPVQTTQSTSSGAFTFSLQTPGNYVMDFAKDGYVDVSKSITLTASSTRVSLSNVILAKSIELTSSIVSMYSFPGSTITLPVSASNLGRETELVTFSVSAPQGWTTRVLQGTYEVTRVSFSSSQTLSLQLEVRIPSTATGGAYDLTLKAAGASQTILNFTVSLGAQTPGIVSGKVVDENGNPLNQVTIDASATVGAPLKTAQSSSDGSFALDLQAGSYVLGFSKAGYSNVTRAVTISSSIPKPNLGNVQLSRKIWLTSSIVSLSVHPGEIVTLPIMVSNMGVDLEPVAFSALAPQGWTTRILDSDFELGTLSLSPSGSTNIKLEVKVPFGSAGSHSLSVTAIGEISTTLNFAVKVEPPSSSMLTCSYPGKSTSPGESAKFQVKLTNPFGMDMRFNLSVESLPANWTGIVKTSEGDFMTEIFLGGHQAADLILEIKSPPNSGTDVGYPVLLRAEAIGQNLTDSLALTVSLTDLARAISVSAKLPEVTIEAGAHVDYQVSVANLGVEERNLALSANVPPDWKVIFKLDNSEITRLLLYGGNKSDIIVQVLPPSAVALGTYTFPFQVLSESGNILAETNLTTTVRGSYTLNMGTSTLTGTVNSGESTSFTVTLTNTGFTVINGIGLNVTLPDDSWSYTVSPVQVSRLGPREPAMFTVTVKTGPNTVSGDYYVSVRGSSEQTKTESRDIRLTVSASTSWGFIGIGVAVGFIVLLIFVFRKFRRR